MSDRIYRAPPTMRIEQRELFNALAYRQVDELNNLYTPAGYPIIAPNADERDEHAQWPRLIRNMIKAKPYKKGEGLLIRDLRAILAKSTPHRVTMAMIILVQPNTAEYLLEYYCADVGRILDYNIMPSRKEYELAYELIGYHAMYGTTGYHRINASMSIFLIRQIFDQAPRAGLVFSGLNWLNTNLIRAVMLSCTTYADIAISCSIDSNDRSVTGGTWLCNLAAVLHPTMSRIADPVRVHSFEELASSLPNDASPMDMLICAVDVADHDTAEKDKVWREFHQSPDVIMRMFTDIGNVSVLTRHIGNENARAAIHRFVVHNLRTCDQVECGCDMPRGTRTIDAIGDTVLSGDLIFVRLIVAALAHVRANMCMMLVSFGESRYIVNVTATVNIVSITIDLYA